MTTHYHGGPLWGGDELLKALYRDSGLWFHTQGLTRLKR